MLALRYDWRGETLFTFHNLADRPAEVRPAFEGVHKLRPLFSHDDDRDDARRGGAGRAGAVRVSVVPRAWGAAVMELRGAKAGRALFRS